MNIKKLEISDELHFHRYKNGVTLKRPTGGQPHAMHTVASLLKTPCSIYFDNTVGVMQKLNEHNVEMCGLVLNLKIFIYQDSSKSVRNFY